jgi:hypothetical protein
MSRKKKIVLGAFLFVFFASARSLVAQTGGGYDLTWNTIDSGGATFSSGGEYSLGATIGQHDASMMSGGSFTLFGGFWRDAVFRVYLPLVLRN